MENKKVAIITGSSRGIGKAIALKLDKEGFITVIVSRNQEDLKKVLKEFSKNAISIKADVSKEKDVISMFKKVMNKFGRIDVVVNNAGYLLFKEIERITKADFDNMVNINIGGSFYCMREYIKIIMKKKSNSGQIINIGSLVSKTPSLFPTRSLYCSTKAAISALSENIQAEVRDRGINVKIATIHPGLVFTGKIIGEDTRDYKEIKKYALSVNDVVNAVQMIINQDKNSNITEVVLRPNIKIKKKSNYSKS